MRQADKQSGAWRTYKGYRNAAWQSGVLRINPETPNIIYVQQNNNEGLMLPAHLKKGVSLPGNYREGDPIKVYGRVSGFMDPQRNSMGVRLTALDFDAPGISEMPSNVNWNTKLPKGLSESSIFPSFFGDGDSIQRVVANDRSNNVEIAGHVCGFMIERERKLENGNVIPRKLFMFIQQSENVLEALPVRYKGRNIMALKNNIRIGTPVFIRGRLRVKHIPLPGSLPNEQGMQPTYSMMFIDANIGGKIEPSVATQGVHCPVRQDFPGWAESMWKSGEDQLRPALQKAIIARESGAAGAAAESAEESSADDELEAHDI